MHPKIAETVEYIRKAHSSPASPLEDIIQDCANRGFSPVQIMAGLQLEKGVPYPDVKKLVAEHPVWGDARAGWTQFHEDLEKALDSELK